MYIEVLIEKSVGGRFEEMPPVENVKPNYVPVVLSENKSKKEIMRSWDEMDIYNRV